MCVLYPCNYLYSKGSAWTPRSSTELNLLLRTFLWYSKFIQQKNVKCYVWNTQYNISILVLGIYSDQSRIQNTLSYLFNISLRCISGCNKVRHADIFLRRHQSGIMRVNYIRLIDIEGEEIEEKTMFYILSIVADNGSNFLSPLWRLQTCYVRGIKKQGNGIFQVQHD